MDHRENSSNGKIKNAWEKYKALPKKSRLVWGVSVPFSYFFCALTLLIRILSIQLSGMVASVLGLYVSSYIEEKQIKAGEGNPPNNRGV